MGKEQLQLCTTGYNYYKDRLCTTTGPFLKTRHQGHKVNDGTCNLQICTNVRMLQVKCCDNLFESFLYLKNVVWFKIKVIKLVFTPLESEYNSGYWPWEEEGGDGWYVHAAKSSPFIIKEMLGFRVRLIRGWKSEDRKLEGDRKVGG